MSWQDLQSKKLEQIILIQQQNKVINNPNIAARGYTSGGCSSCGKKNIIQP